MTRNFRERSLTLNPWAKPLPGTSLPLPDLVGLPLRKYVTPIVVAPASTSRGCYWNRCTFCDDAGRLEQRYRRVPVATLLRTFRTYQDLGVQAVLLCDECISPATLAGLAASMPGAGIHLSWFVLARFERALLPLIGTAAAAGLRLLAFGLESGSPRIVKLMDKGYDHSTAQAIIDECARHGVGVQLNTIIGYPGETIEDAVDTVDFLERNADKVASIRVTRWYLGVNSIMGRNPERYGVTPLGDRPLSRDPATFRLGPGLTRSQVDALVEVLRAHASFGEKVITEDSGFLVEDYEFARMILSDQARGVQRNQIPPNLPQDGRSVTAEG